MKALKQKKSLMLQKKINYQLNFVFFIGIMFLLSACNRPAGILSERKMTTVLVNMHKTEATLTEKGIYYGAYSKKAPYFNNVFKRNGITQAQFDSTLVWYTKNPQQFENLYDEVIKQLTILQKDVDNNKFHPIDYANLDKIRVNVWNKATNYQFTKDSTRTKLDFEIKQPDFLYRDVFELKLTLKISKVDSCKKQGIETRINYYNGTSDYSYTTVKNDGLTRKFTIRIPAHRMLKIKSVSGKLLASSAYKGVFGVTLDSIQLFREFRSLQQDSLKRLVQEADSTHYVGAPNYDYLMTPRSPVHTFRKSRILKPL